MGGGVGDSQEQSQFVKKIKSIQVFLTEKIPAQIHLLATGLVTLMESLGDSTNLVDTKSPWPPLFESCAQIKQELLENESRKEMTQVNLK